MAKDPKVARALAAEAKSKEAEAAQAAMGKRGKKKNKEMTYYIWGGVVGGIVLLCIFLALVDGSSKRKSGAPAPSDAQVNDASFIQDVEEKAAGNWTPAASDFFYKTTLGDMRSWAGVKISNMVDMAGAVKSCEKFDDTMEGGVMKTHYDARKEYPQCFQRPVYNSQNCSSSYAIAAASALAARFCIADPEKDANLQLSPQQIMSCDKKSRACKGGGIDYVWPYIENRGLYPEKCLPYQAKGGKEVPCKTECTESDKHKAISHCVMGNVKQLKRDIENYGPVVAPAYLFDDFLIYKSGVYSPTEGGKAIHSWHASYRNDPNLHAVMVLGWGKHQGTEYWIIENSWGTGWGEDGYARVARKSILLEHYMLVGYPETPEALEAKAKAEKEAAERKEKAKIERAEREEIIKQKREAWAKQQEAEGGGDAGDSLDDVDDTDLDEVNLDDAPGGEGGDDEI